jgi:hypothetical protein
MSIHDYLLQGPPIIGAFALLYAADRFLDHWRGTQKATEDQRLRCQASSGRRDCSGEPPGHGRDAFRPPPKAAGADPP